MTLVPSLRRLLSGNSLSLLLLFFVILPACKTAPPDGDLETVIIKDGEIETGETDTTSSGVFIDGESGDTLALIDTTTKYQPEPHPIESIRVAMLLPFKTDTLYEIQQKLRKVTDREDGAKIQLPGFVNSSLDFYLGYLSALSGLRQGDIKVELQLFDTKGSSSVTQNILDTAGLISYDMIVGPMFNGPSRLVADHARENRVWHVLPFSPSGSITSDNSYHIKINPGIEQHLEAILDHIARSRPGTEIILPYQSGQSMEVDLKNEIQVIVNNINLNQPDSAISINPIGVFEEEGRRTFKISTYLSEVDTNIVLLPSFDPGFIQNICRQLSQLSEDKAIILYGMPNWGEFEEINLDYLVQLNYHFTSEKWLDKENPIFEQLEREHKKEMNNPPHDYFYLGYDLSRFFTGLWQNHGSSFESFLTRKAYDGLYGSYQIRPVYPNLTEGKTMSIDHYSNSGLRVLKYEDYLVVPAK